MATLIYAGNKHNYDGTSQLEVASGALVKSPTHP
jgi:hypothetical protein